MRSLWQSRKADREERRRRIMKVLTQAPDLVSNPQPPAQPQVDAQGIEYRDYHDSPASRKRHHTERYRQASPGAIVERWTNAKSGFVGYLTGRGYTSGEIERILNDGTSMHTVRGMWRRWGLPLTETGGRRSFVVPVSLGRSARSKLAKSAKKVGITPDEFLRRIIVSVVDDDLYKAVVDDRFDEPQPKS